MTRGIGVWLALGATALVIAAVAIGLMQVGGPGEARLERLDAKRLDHLRALERAIGEAWRREDRPPTSLDSALIRYIGRVPTDPETGEPYAYRVLSDSTAELCATFAQAEEDADVGFSNRSDIGPHSAGRHCFTLYRPR